MSSLMDFIKSVFLAFVSPIARVFLSIGGVVSLIVGAVANPEGAVNLFLCKIIDMVASVFPSTPENMKITSLIAQLGSSMPLVGGAVISSLMSTVLGMFAVILIVKLYKLIPFKAT